MTSLVLLYLYDFLLYFLLYLYLYDFLFLWLPVILIELCISCLLFMRAVFDPHSDLCFPLRCCKVQIPSLKLHNHLIKSRKAKNSQFHSTVHYFVKSNFFYLIGFLKAFLLLFILLARLIHSTGSISCRLPKSIFVIVYLASKAYTQYR